MVQVPYSYLDNHEGLIYNMANDTNIYVRIFMNFVFKITTFY